MIDPEVHYLRDVDDVQPFMDWLIERCRRGEVLAVDTETTALHPVTWRRRGFVRLWQVGDAHEAWAIPAQEWHRLVHHAMDLIAMSRVRVVLQNCRYDLHAMAGEGWPLPDWDRIEDTEILSKIGRPWAVRHGLKPMAEELFGEWAGEGQRQLNAFKKATGSDWATVQIDHPLYWAYGCFDTVLTRHVWDRLESHAGPESWYQIEMEYQRLAYGWEEKGLLVDPEFILTQQAAYEAKLVDLTQKLADVGITKPRSNKMIEAVLADLGYEFEDFTAKGNVSLDKVVMARIAQMGGVTGRAARLLMEYRRTDKWKAVYFDGMLDAMTSDQRVHPFVRTMGAKTGRSSITVPPLQTIPKDAGPRSVFLADRGMELWPIDYDSQELRVFAALANEIPMIEEFNGPDPDLHSLVARMASVERDVAKTLNYARLYGAGVSKLALGAGKTEPEMAEILDRIDTRFPAAAAFMEGVVAEARQRHHEAGYAYTEVARSGRRIGVEIDKAYTALNYKIQGHGADVLKLAAIRLYRAGFGEAVMLPVHDELLMQFPKGEGAHLAQEAAEIMRDEALSVPLTASPEGPFTRWGDKYQKGGSS